MTTTLLVAVTFIVAALVFYSIGVWSERFAGRLQVQHLIFFWLGLVCDTTGTTLMIEISRGTGMNIHLITGFVAIFLMFVHAFWATLVLVRKDGNAIVNFHKFSVFAWGIWLIPFFTGFFLARQI